MPCCTLRRLKPARTARSTGSAAALGTKHSCSPVRRAPGVWVPPLTVPVSSCRPTQPRPSPVPLFGLAGGLEIFRTTPDGYRREIEIIAQPNIPATQDALP